ncbi:hypothetical protein SCLCIDRAFT_115263, partial [Scleroderma citrinum Foug A]
LWIPERLFPLSPRPDFDPRSPLHWKSPQGKCDGARAELYGMLPQEMHETVETLTKFPSMFRHTVNTERSSVLNSIKGVTGAIFAEFSIDPRVFIEISSKEKNENVVWLLHRKGEAVTAPGSEDAYHRVAPVLFKDPWHRVVSEFLQSQVLVKDKAKTRGCPKGQGQRLGANSVTEGLITAAAVVARFLLSHDEEFVPVGEKTGIHYEDDFDHYLSLLFKGNNWAINVITFYNQAVFGESQNEVDQSTPSLADPTRTWEDEFLRELEEDPMSVSSHDASAKSQNTYCI